MQNAEILRRRSGVDAAGATHSDGLHRNARLAGTGRTSHL